MLFEMLTGRRTFAGEDVADTLAAILSRQPAWSLLPPETPPSIRRLLRRCLEKDRTHRLADIADARLELAERAAEEDATPVSSAPSRSWRRWAPWSVAAVLAAALALIAVQVRHRPMPGTDVYRVSIVLPGRLGAARSTVGARVALSPDGRRVALVISEAGGHSRIWIRSLDGLAAQPLADTSDAEAPFWSPDGRWLAFIQGRRLKKIDLSGVQAITICEDALGGGAWSPDDVILFTHVRGSLAQVPAAGGTPVPLTTIASNEGQVFNVAQQFLDRRTFIYVSYGQASVHHQPYVASLDPGVAPARLPLETNVVQYAAGFLWFRRGSTLMAQPFDPRARTVAGEAVPVAEQVRLDNGWVRAGIFSVSATGTLVFQADPAPGYDLTWYDRAGRVLGTLGTPADYADVQIAPDGQRVLVSVAPSGTPTRDLWLFDVARGLRTRFTFDDDRPIRGPIWSRDGRRVVYASERGGRIVLLQRPASGAEGPSLLFDDEFDKEPVSWSPDGRFLLFMRRPTINAPAPWVLPVEGNAQPFELPQPRARFPQFSPDGRFIVYDSPASGRIEVYVAPFPGPGRSVQVSTATGFNPRWRADGKEILYLNPAENKLMSAAITVGKDGLDVGEVKSMFELLPLGPRFGFDVSPDGQRVLALTQASPAAAAPLTLIVNWPALLKK